MVKVGATVGFTLNLGSYQSARYDFSVADIDADAPLEPQLNAAKAALMGTAKWCEDTLYEQMRSNSLIEAIRDREVTSG